MRSNDYLIISLLCFIIMTISVMYLLIFDIMNVYLGFLIFFAGIGELMFGCFAIMEKLNELIEK